MTQRLSKESRRKISATIEREEEAKKAQRKAMDEQELRRLTRQTRMMKEAKLKDAAVETKKKVKNILAREKDSLEDCLKLMKSQRRCILDNKQAEEISNLFAQGDDLDEAIEVEKQYLKDLESQIQNDTKNIQVVKRNKVEKKEVVGTSEYLLKKGKEREERAMESLKSRLAAEQKQLAMIIKENEDMRENVKHLLKEKGQFNKLYGELMRKLTRGKVIMADIVEQSRHQFQDRDELIRKIEALRSRDKTDLSKRMEEMQEYEIKLYEDEKLASFRLRVQQMRDRLSGEMRKTNKGSIEQQELSSRLEKVNDYWSKLQDATGISTCEEMCKHILNEDSNLFRLFNFNNEVRDQMEVLTYKTSELITTVNEETDNAENDMEESIKTKSLMEKKLDSLEHKLSNMKDEVGANERLYSRLLEKIKNLFDIMQCKPSALQDLLGENTKVTEHNCRLFLNLIETEIIRVMDSITACGIGTGTVPSSKSLVSRSEFSKSKTDLRSTLQLKKIVTRQCFECDRVKPRIY